MQHRLGLARRRTIAAPDHRAEPHGIAQRHGLARRRTIAACLAAGLAVLAGAPAVWAQGDVKRGQAQAALCAACHGPKGVSVNPLWPSLAGQQAAYLAKQIRAFRDGERKEVTMQPFVAALSDQEIEDLAAYYASLSPCP